MEENWRMSSGFAFGVAMTCYGLLIINSLSPVSRTQVAAPAPRAVQQNVARPTAAPAPPAVTDPTAFSSPPSSAPFEGSSPAPAPFLAPSPPPAAFDSAPPAAFGSPPPAPFDSAPPAAFGSPPPAPFDSAPSPAPAPYASAPSPAPAPYASAPSPAPAPYASAPSPAPAPYASAPSPAPAPAPYASAPSPAPAPYASAPSPAPAPAPYASAPSPAPVSFGGASPKKGFVVGKDDSKAGGAKVNSLNCKWYYTWGPAPMSPPPASGVKFSPMLWNLSKASPSPAGELAAIQALPTASTENVLLTYNEPDGVNASAQGNMKVSDAVAFWPNIVATGRRLGSPVMYGDTVEVPTDTYGTGKNVNNDAAPAGMTGSTVQVNISNNSIPNLVTLNPLIWLDNFLIQIAQQPGTRFPDFICIHWYGKPHAPSFLGYLTNVNAKYNLPIWVTEYSCADWDATCCPTVHLAGYDWSWPTSDNISTNGTAQFMVQTVQGMNQMPFVERFSWKERTLLGNSDGTPTGADSYMSITNADYMNQSALFQSYNRFPTALPPLTPLGQLYASL